ncbi:MAG: hypothetical protein WCO58_03255 [bacterium]
MENFNFEKSNIEKKEVWKKVEQSVFNENNFYRVVTQAGYDDFINNQIIRSSPTGSSSRVVEGVDIGGRPTIFPAFSKGSPDATSFQEGVDNYIFETAIPMYKRGEENPVTGVPIKGRHWAYRPIDENGDVVTEIKPEQITNIYKVDKDKNIYLKHD